MDFGKLPEQGTIALIVITACITSLVVGVFGKKLAEFVLELFLWPIRQIYDAIYRWVAPRNPLSISMRTYRRHVLRSNLTRMENPVGPSLDVPLEYAFAPLKLRSGTTQDAIDLFGYIAANRGCVILGGPGTGKTTLMKSLVTSILKKQCHNDLNDLIPVFVVLRNLAKNQQSVFDAIVSAFDQYHFPGADNFVRSSLDAGRMLIVLTGCFLILAFAMSISIFQSFALLQSEVIVVSISPAPVQSFPAEQMTGFALSALNWPRNIFLTAADEVRGTSSMVNVST
jgi:Cdc6-like AAA superfamily ATPase